MLFLSPQKQAETQKPSTLLHQGRRLGVTPVALRPTQPRGGRAASTRKPEVHRNDLGGEN